MSKIYQSSRAQFTLVSVDRQEGWSQTHLWRHCDLTIHISFNNFDGVDGVGKVSWASWSLAYKWGDSYTTQGNRTCLQSYIFNGFLSLSYASTSPWPTLCVLSVPLSSHHIVSRRGLLLTDPMVTRSSMYAMSPYLKRAGSQRSSLIGSVGVDPWTGILLYVVCLGRKGGENLYLMATWWKAVKLQSLVLTWQSEVGCYDQTIVHIGFKCEAWVYANRLYKIVVLFQEECVRW